MGQMYIRRCKGLVKAKQQRVNCAEVCAIKKCKQVRLVQSLPSQKQLTNKHSSELSCGCIVSGCNVLINLNLTLSQNNRDPYRNITKIIEFAREKARPRIGLLSCPHPDSIPFPLFSLWSPYIYTRLCPLHFTLISR